MSRGSLSLVAGDEQSSFPVCGFHIPGCWDRWQVDLMEQGFPVAVTLDLHMPKNKIKSQLDNFLKYSLPSSISQAMRLQTRCGSFLTQPVSVVLGAVRNGKEMQRLCVALCMCVYLLSSLM